MYSTYSKLTIETLEQRCGICSELTIIAVFIVNFEHISHLCSSVSIVNFEHEIAGWEACIQSTTVAFTRRRKTEQGTSYMEDYPDLHLNQRTNKKHICGVANIWSNISHSVFSKFDYHHDYDHNY